MTLLCKEIIKKVFHAFASVTVSNGEERPLSDQESELFRIFSELSTLEQSKVLVFVAELKEAHK